MTLMIETLRRWIWPTLAVLAALLLLLLWLSPAERRLGQTVKLVYLHGALVRTAIFLLGLSLPVNLIAIFTMGKSWLSWGKALVWGGVTVWLGHTLFSMITTYAAWGVFIAWSEPRTRFTFATAGAGLLMLTVAYLMDSPRFSALVFVALAGPVLVLTPRLGLIQHPLDPIGTSSSTPIRAFYTAILLVTMALGGGLVVYFQGGLQEQKM